MTNSTKLYWAFDQSTREIISGPHAGQFRGGIWHMPENAITVEPLPLKENVAVLALPDSSGTEYVEDHRGKTVYDKQTLQQQDVTELGPLPDSVTELAPGHDDIWGIDGWQLDPAAITRHQNAKHAEINTWRDGQELATVEHNGQYWDADPTSRARIESVLLAGAMPLDYWTDANNQDQPMTLEQLRDLYAAIVQQGGRIHDRQRTMKAEVNTLTTIEEVQAYPVGWAAEVTP